MAGKLLVVAAVAAALIAPGAAHAHLLSKLPIVGPALTPPATPDTSPSAVGSFSAPFEEPGPKCVTDSDGIQRCKPTAGSVSVLRDGRILYWNALEGTENVDAAAAAEYGAVLLNDQARLLTLAPDGSHSWTTPTPADGGANPGGYDNEALVPGGNDELYNDGALFCSDLAFLPDGRILAIGGTAYYHDPRLPGTRFGLTEFEGLRNARIFDPATDTWAQTGSMRDGRWYPTIVSLADGSPLVASGVTKLVKPIYIDRPADSGLNVKRMERYDVATGTWTDEGTAAERSLPLYPRLHLLPNGHVFYPAAGQSFNPFGQAYDELLWNIAGSYDPVTRRWTDLGIPGLEGGGLVDLENLDLGDPLGDLGNLGIPGGGRSIVHPGFRGSTFSVMLPLEPPYKSASFLTGGGVLNPPSPGSYFATSDSRITTVDVSGATPAMKTRGTGDMGRPRWYPSGILLPTGEVIAVSGSDRDVVAAPGLEFPVKMAELFDPKTETWRPLKEADRPRTYHNSATLLPDGRVLIGGHAPVNTMYADTVDLPGGFAPNERDPSFEIYSPPYLFRGARPAITAAPAHVDPGQTFSIGVAGAATDAIESVVLVRNATTTHLIDADQRSVVLPVVARGSGVLTVTAPAGRAVLPPGPYMLFVNRSTASGPVPSVSRPVLVR